MWGVGLSKALDADVVIAAVRPNTVIVRGLLGLVDTCIDMMLGSGSSVFPVREDVLSEVTGVCSAPLKDMKLVTAAGEPIPVLGYVSAPVE